MVNPSKAVDPRCWARWRTSAAVGNISSGRYRQESREWKRRWKEFGNLNGEERNRLAGYCFGAGPTTFDEQVDRYVLEIKVGRPERAARMAEDAAPLLRAGISSEEDAERLCTVIHRHAGGALCDYDRRIMYVVEKGTVYGKPMAGARLR